jgi:Tfp pilus assembly protein PilV
MLSFATLQGRLRLHADVAKQRAEAVRMAQADLENFRAYGSIASDATVAGIVAYDGISADAPARTVAAADVTTKTNAMYSLMRRVTDSAIAGMKDVSIVVSWADRTDTRHDVTLRSVIARSDPAVAAALALPSDRSSLRNPHGRSIQVPMPAKNLGNGSSVLKPLSGGSVAYVFSNDSGIVTQRCTGLPGAAVTAGLTPAVLSQPGVTCTAISAYLISGFIRTSLGVPNAASPNDAPPGPLAVRVDFDNTPPPPAAQGMPSQLSPSYWPAVDGATGKTIGTGTATFAPAECSNEPLQTVRFATTGNVTQPGSGTTRPEAPTTVVAIVPAGIDATRPEQVAPWVGLPASGVQNPQHAGERYVGYACLVHPVDLDGNRATSAAYTARTTIWPTSGWALGTSSDTVKKICRYSADYDLGGGVFTVNAGRVTTIDNLEHPYAYLNASRSLAQQNFLIIDGNRNCPTDAPVEGFVQDRSRGTDRTTVAHQP